MTKLNLNNYKSIAVIQTAFLGDFVLSLPLFQVLRKNTQESKIISVCTPISSQTAALSSSIDVILPYDKRGQHKGYSGIKLLAQQLKEQNVDLIIAPHRSFRTTLLAKLVDAKMTIGFDINAFSFLYKRTVPYDKLKHETLRNLSLLAPFDNINRIYSNIDLSFDKNDEQLIEQLLLENATQAESKIVVLAPGSVWATKKWCVEHFANLASMMTSKGLIVFVIGAKEDSKDAEVIVNASGALNLCGKTSISQSISLLTHSDLLITNDSAPTHFAGIVKCPTITLYGPTIPEFGFAPIGKLDRTLSVGEMNCRPCAIHGSKECPLKHFKCMKELQPDYVFRNAMEVLYLQ